MTNEPGVPLSHYIERHPGTGVRFTCWSCMATHAVPMDRVLARLKATGAGDEQTGIKVLGQRSRRPCAKCGKATWDSAPAWRAFPSTPGL